MNKIVEKDWVFYGRWKEKPLNDSYWVVYHSPADKEYPEYKDLLLGYFCLDGYFFISKKRLDFINQLVKNKLESDPEFFKRLFELTEQTIKEYSQLKNEKQEDLINFLNKNIKLHFFWHIMSTLNLSITNYLERKAKEFGVNYLDYILVTKKTILMKEQEEFKELYLLFKNKDPSFKGKLKNYFKEYEFFGTYSFGGKPQTKESVLKRLKLFEPKEGIERNIPKDEFFNRYKDVIEIASDAAYYRMDCADCFLKISFSFWPHLTNLAQQHNISFDDVIYYDHKEVLDLIKLNKKVNPSLINQRKDMFGIINEDGEAFYPKKDWIKKYLDILLNVREQDEMVGSVAFKGYAKGKARVIEEAKDIYKIKEGDILVTHETTPDYVLAMGKAAAIVTEQGGITSHAAIISREMQKPCIVGVKNATRIIKDGDLIEVDAEKGIVRKINQKEK